MPHYGKTDLVRVQRALEEIRGDLEVKAPAGAGVEPIRTQPTPTIMAAKGYVMPLRANVTQLRYWADTNEWIRAAIDHRCNQVGHTDWGIVPIEPGEPFDDELRTRILTALVFPNTRKDSFRSLMQLVTQDLMVLDAGVMEKQRTFAHEPCGAVAVDGGAVRIFPDWDGTDQNAPHYAWMPMNTWRASFTNDEMIYIMARPSTHRLYGLSPLEILKETIEAEINAAVYNKRQVQQASPSGIINLGENIGREQVASFRAFWDSEIAGRRGTAFMGGAKNPEFIRWDQNNREMQYMQWQVYLIRKICAVFGMNAQDLGMTLEMNRATAEVAEGISEDSGLRPLLSLIEEYLNREFVADFQRIPARKHLARGEWSMSDYRRAEALMALNPRIEEHVESYQMIRGTTKALEEAAFLNVMFRYNLPTGRSLAQEAEYATKALGGLPWHTVDEIRKRQNLDPVPGGSEIIVMTPVGAIPLAMLVGSAPAETPAQAKMLQALLESPALRLDTSGFE